MRSLTVGCILAGVLGWATLPGISLAAITTVALGGDPAPGTGAGIVYNGFDTPVLNSVGETAFSGVVAGTGVSPANNSGIWSEAGGTLGLVARGGDPAPGTGTGVVYFNFFSVVLNSAGETAFGGFLNGTGINSGNEQGIWSDAGGTLGLVARTGDVAPGTGVAYSSFASPVLNSVGETAFRGFLAGAGTNTGIWSEAGGTLDLVARTGDAAPGTDAGVAYSSLLSPVLNAAGETAFFGNLTGTGVNSTNNHGIWSEAGGTLDLIARRGDGAPGTAAGVVYFNLGSAPVINSAGETAFVGTLTGAGVDSTNDSGIWSEAGGTLGLVARAGDAAPGTSAGVVYSSFSAPVLNSAGDTAFSGYLAGMGVDSTNENGIWSEAAGMLGLVARSGDAAPGTGVGVVYSGFGSPVLNSAGETTFFGFLTGTGITSSNDNGIWSEAGGTLGLVAREGDLLEVASGDFRTISALAFYANSGNEDGRRSGFNDAGQVAFQASFTDGSQGVFLWQASQANLVPEPKSIALGLIGAVLLMWRVRRGPRKTSLQAFW